MSGRDPLQAAQSMDIHIGDSVQSLHKASFSTLPFKDGIRSRSCTMMYVIEFAILRKAIFGFKDSPRFVNAFSYTNALIGGICQSLRPYGLSIRGDDTDISKRTA